MPRNNTSLSRDFFENFARNCSPQKTILEELAAKVLLHPRGYGAIPHAWAKGFLPNTERTGNMNIRGARVLKCVPWCLDGTLASIPAAMKPLMTSMLQVSWSTKRQKVPVARHWLDVFRRSNPYPTFVPRTTCHSSWPETSRLRHEVARRDHVVVSLVPRKKGTPFSL